MTGDEAMTAYARGDASAFSAVYDAVAPKLEAYLLSRARDRSLVEDLMQQTFLQMHACRGSFIPGAAVLPWACTIGLHLWIDVRKKHGREEPRDLTEERHEDALLSREPNAEDLLASREMASQISDAYASLTPLQRAAFQLRHEGHSVLGTAQALNTSSMGIKLRVRRALVTLRSAVTSGRSTPPRKPPINTLKGSSR